jgi:hypothetical protein
MHPSAILHQDFSIQFADTNVQRQNALRIRYEVLTKELGRQQYANDHDGTYSDALDAGMSHIILVENLGTPVGTLRFTLRSEAVFLKEDELLFSEFLNDHDPLECAIADRGAILQPFRKAQLYPIMWAFGFDFARARGIRVVLGVIDAHNSSLNAFHEKQGWKVLRECVTEGNDTWKLIVKEL